MGLMCEKGFFSYRLSINVFRENTKISMRNVLFFLKLKKSWEMIAEHVVKTTTLVSIHLGTGLE
jgi:hypothetical protein